MKYCVNVGMISGIKAHSAACKAAHKHWLIFLISVNEVHDMTSSYWDTQRIALRSDDRRNEIVKHVTSASKKISVDELASLFEVSAVTIRSDLDWLERQGKLKRVRGGAIVLDRIRDVADISRRMTINIERKKHISQVTNSCVDDGDAIFVDSGSTTFEFVKTLKNK